MIISTSEYIQSLQESEKCYHWNNYLKIGVTKDCKSIDVDCAGNLIITKLNNYKFDIRDTVVSKSKLISILEDKVKHYYDFYGQYLNATQIENEKLKAIVNFRKEVEKWL